MSNLNYRVRPLPDRLWLTPEGSRVRSQFGPARASGLAAWRTSTFDALNVELRALRAENVILGLDVSEADLRLGGQMRANARPSSPAVELSFASTVGPLRYRLDRFVSPSRSLGADWLHNLRAIVLTLNSLRSIDRYGVAGSGEQYAGWRQIEAQPHSAAPEDPLDTLFRLSGALPGSQDTLARINNMARRNAHPDRGGSTEDWLAYQAAASALGLL